MAKRFESATDAVSAGGWFVNGPVGLLLFAGPVLALKLLSGYWSGICFIGNWCAAWLWWSVAVPKWRRWVLASEVDLIDVQDAGQRSGLIWSPGSVLERTEIPRGPAIEWSRRLEAELERLEGSRPFCL